MQIAMITPHYHPADRGNAVTVRRLEKYIGRMGGRLKVFSLDAVPAEEIGRAMALNPPDLIHALHGYSGGRVAWTIAQVYGIPYLVTLTGSDVYEALADGRRGETLAALKGATALVVFDKSVKQRLADHFPLLTAKIAVIPQGVELPEGYGPEPGATGEGNFTFLLPAGLRPVKNVLFPLAPLAELYKSELRVRLLLAGPVIDTTYAAMVLEQLEGHPFARYLGCVAHDAIGALYRGADVVLNTSRFEGGMANSLLEALAFGKPVLAAAIEGNRSLVSDGKTGLLYRDEAEFLAKARRFLGDAPLRQRLGENGQRLVLAEYTPEREAAAYLELYKKIVAGAQPFGC